MSEVNLLDVAFWHRVPSIPEWERATVYKVVSLWDDKLFSAAYWLHYPIEYKVKEWRPAPRTGPIFAFSQEKWARNFTMVVNEDTSQERKFAVYKSSGLHVWRPREIGVISSRYAEFWEGKRFVPIGAPVGTVCCMNIMLQEEL